MQKLNILDVKIYTMDIILFLLKTQGCHVTVTHKIEIIEGGFSVGLAVVDSCLRVDAIKRLVSGMNFGESTICVVEALRFEDSKFVCQFLNK